MIELKNMSWADLEKLAKENHVTLWCTKFLEDQTESYFQDGMRFNIDRIKIDQEEDGCVNIDLDLSEHLLFNALLETNTWFDHNSKPRLDGHGSRFEKTLYLANNYLPEMYFSKIEVNTLDVGNNQQPTKEKLDFSIDP